MRPRAAILASSLVLLCAGCGPPPPQAPTAQANRVASAITGIAEACGESYQSRALPDAHPGDAALEAEAASRALELAGVYLQNPGWIYQGETLQQVVAQSVHYLRACDLGSAADLLVARTRRP
jgi:hypothetical protein